MAMLQGIILEVILIIVLTTIFVKLNNLFVKKEFPSIKKRANFGSSKQDPYQIG